ncbi:DUF6783 domain-containing protein [Blautia faecis]|uniref:DUF6783 domain-containing protein n=1 Tax=Blautia faecis TaxID=871665 RepID=UPI003A7F20DE
MKNHSCNLYAPLCSIFYLYSVVVARIFVKKKRAFPFLEVRVFFNNVSCDYSVQFSLLPCHLLLLLPSADRKTDIQTAPA